MVKVCHGGGVVVVVVVFVVVVKGIDGGDCGSTYINIYIYG